jgi:hypothetical protein
MRLALVAPFVHGAVPPLFMPPWQLGKKVFVTILDDWPLVTVAPGLK